MTKPKKRKKVKLWSGLVLCFPKVFGEDCKIRQHRTIVKASSQKRACELLNEHTHNGHNPSNFRDFWSLTGNPTSLKVIEGVEGEGVWVVPGKQHNICTVEEFRRLV